MSLADFKNVPLMRKSKDTDGAQIKKLKSIIEKKYNVQLKDYYELHKWSVDHIAEFYAELWDFIGIIFSKEYEKVIDLSIPMADSPEWFPGARLNFAENLLKYRDDGVAIVTAGEESSPRKITFAELFEEAQLYAAAFKKCNLKKGDVVACVVSNRKEPIYAMLGTTSLGAIWTGAVPFLGPQAILSRLKLVEPKILLTIDRFVHDKEEIDMFPKIKSIADGLPSLQNVVIITTKEESKKKDISKIRGSCFLDDFLASGLHENGSVPPMEFEQVSFSHPVFINFTSGTTGSPKAIIHGFGALIPSIKDFQLSFDAIRGDIFYSMSTVGWVSWNFIIPLLFGGIGVFLFEGMPYFLSPTYFWDLVQDNAITHLFLPASVVNDMEKLDYRPKKRHNLSSLKLAVAGSSAVKPASYDFMYSIKKEMTFSALYGSTELIGAKIFVETSVNVYKGELPAPALGLDIQCVDQHGNPVEGEYGELIIAKPTPSLLLGLWGDPDGSKRKKSYFSRFSGKFSTGDFAIVNPFTKGYIICGRSDDTLKQRGTRFTSSEISNVVEEIPEVRDSMCVSQYNKDMEERAVLFLKMREGCHFDDNLVSRIRKTIARELSAGHVPDVILETRDIPYNINGKKTEIIVKNIINNRPFSAETVANPQYLEYFSDIPELQEFL